MIAAAAASILLLAACVEPLPPDGDAGSQLSSCAELGCPSAFCAAAGDCRCVPPDADVAVPCTGPDDDAGDFAQNRGAGSVP